MFLSRQIRAKTDGAAEILTEQNGPLRSKMNLSVVTGIFVQPPFGPGYRNL